jgi:inorganic phosphate transporter, PiT family
MFDPTLILVLVVVLALLFDFSNGWHDSANAIATVVSTHVLSPGQAVMLAAVLNVAGAFMSTAVASSSRP